jgi:hypothetical protein
MKRPSNQANGIIRAVGAAGVRGEMADIVVPGAALGWVPFLTVQQGGGRSCGLTKMNPNNDGLHDAPPTTLE